jgi:tetratricopeptide (TPR) repeat protein
MNIITSVGRSATLHSISARKGKLNDAEAVAREALAIQRKQGDGNPIGICLFLRQLASVLRHQDKLSEAEEILREELALRRKVLGQDHPEVAGALFVLSGYLSDQKKLPEAEIAVREALAIQRKRLPSGHPAVADTFNLLANLLRSSGQALRGRGDLARGTRVIPASPGARRCRGLENPSAPRRLPAQEGKMVEAEACLSEMADSLAHAEEMYPKREDLPPMTCRARWALGNSLRKSGARRGVGKGVGRRAART